MPCKLLLTQPNSSPFTTHRKLRPDVPCSEYGYAFLGMLDKTEAEANSCDSR